MVDFEVSASQVAPKRPNDRSIAFAISVVLSKPADLNIKEYIFLIRQHVAKGRREDAVSSAHRHLDRSSYWRSEYERVKDALSASLGETVDLRREIESLKAKADAPRPTNPTKKRKKVDEDVVLVRGDPKKAKRDVSPPRLLSGADVDVEKDFDFTEAGEIGNVLLRTLYQLHTALKSRGKSKPTVLAHHLTRAASLLHQVVKEIVEQSLTQANAGAQMLKANLAAAGRAAALLIMGFKTLGLATGGAEVLGQVIYAFVQMYAKLLDVPDLVSEAGLRKPDGQYLASKTGKSLKSATGKGKSKVQQPKAPNLKDNAALNTITGFLCSIIDLLDPTVEAHKALFEGFAYCTLNKLGSRLYVCVFGRQRGVSLEAEIAKSNEADEIEDDFSQSASPDEADTAQAKLEAPYLVHLLTRLMNAAPSHLGSVMSARTGKPKQANNKGSMKGALAITAKDRLQRTLVNCMFGTEGNTEDDPFMDCLKMPLAPFTPLPMPRVKEADALDWFKEEMWRLLGWEILSKEGEW